MFFGKVLLTIGTILFILALPVAYFIGGMSTDDPNAPWWAFWAGFFFIEGIPILIILSSLVIIKIVKRDEKKYKESQLKEK
ncbi:hypothetical protein ACFCYN_11060 [Gottfriedia sp. NPDC056225]|uniref:hypothetical protein n=1 Tax=Gottfriedia sp. NPDC056225 TaxID=3345751 RepID=UPI001558968B|nr:hypothetical protein HPK19_21030 [Arthrobacter citreus]